jgi:putative spermidine/putrescine transport system substrate-binding protein
MSSSKMTRRTLVSAFGIAAFGRTAPAQLVMPKSPVTISVVDACGDLALTQKIFENYRQANPNLVSRFTFTKAPEPELPGKIKAQQQANRVDIDLVLAGYDLLSSGSSQNLWMELLPAHQDELPKLDNVLIEGARRIQAQTRGQGLCISFCPYGPLLEYMPDRVTKVPTTADELLSWTKQNPGRFMYARPANSGPGRSLLTGLPYILGDSNPLDPAAGWDKTWAYLKAIGENIEYYPSGTGPVLKALGEGSVDMIPSSTGWDINPRALGIVPKEARIATLKGFHWVSDAHCWCVPKGVGDDKLAVLLDLMRFVLTREQQAYVYDEGYSYPGPAVKDVPLSMAPESSQKVIREFGRPEYDALIAEVPTELPLEPDKLVLAFRRWDEEVGGKKNR